GAAEDSAGVGVVAAPVAGALVDVGGSGVVVAAAVGQDGEVVAQALVAGPAERGGSAFARFDRDGGLAAVCGERVAVGVAGAVVADLAEQAGGSDDALGVAEDRQEDRPVGVGANHAADLAGQFADLADDR